MRAVGSTSDGGIEDGVQSPFLALGINKNVSTIRSGIPLNKILDFVDPEAREDDLDLSSLPGPGEEYVEGRYQQVGKSKQ